jgi:hypothetical protein
MASDVQHQTWYKTLSPSLINKGLLDLQAPSVGLEALGRWSLMGRSSLCFLEDINETPRHMRRFPC